MPDKGPAALDVVITSNLVGTRAGNAARNWDLPISGNIPQYTRRASCRMTRKTGQCDTKSGCVRY